MEREKLIKYFSNFQRRRPQRERRVDGQPRVGRALLAAVAADGGRLGPAVHSLHRVKDGRMDGGRWEEKADERDDYKKLWILYQGGRARLALYLVFLKPQFVSWEIGCRICWWRRLGEPAFTDQLLAFEVLGVWAHRTACDPCWN